MKNTGNFTRYMQLYRYTINNHHFHHLGTLKVYHLLTKQKPSLLLPPHLVQPSATPPDISLDSSTFGFTCATLDTDMDKWRENRWRGIWDKQHVS